VWFLKQLINLIVNTKGNIMKIIKTQFYLSKLILVHIYHELNLNRFFYRFTSLAEVYLFSEKNRTIVILKQEI
jgi:hypothetical protein